MKRPPVVVVNNELFTVLGAASFAAGAISLRTVFTREFAFLSQSHSALLLATVGVPTGTATVSLDSPLSSREFFYNLVY
jgi:hypothetical protein